MMSKLFGLRLEIQSWHQRRRACWSLGLAVGTLGAVKIFRYDEEADKWYLFQTLRGKHEDGKFGRKIDFRPMEKF